MRRNSVERRRSQQRLTVLASAISTLLGGGATVLTGTAQAQEAVEEITVTGSRIVRRDLSSSSPIVTIGSEAFETTSAVSIEEVLNRMPQFTPAGALTDNQYTSTQRTQPDALNIMTGIASLNMRSLGTNRSLVLVNGRRAQPANGLGIVDINTIPSAAIERVETITGGASAVYGADAMAGVVNFVLKSDFEGFDMDFRTGMTERGDGDESSLSILMGMNSGDGRGNVMLGVEATRRGRVDNIDRDWRAAQFFDEGTNAGGFLNPSAYNITGAGQAENRPSQAVVDQLFARYGAAPGTVTDNTLYFNPDGTVFVPAHGGLGYNGPFHSTDFGSGFAGIRFGPSGNLQQPWMTSMLSSPMERHSLFGSAAYDVSDHVRVIAQATFAGTRGESVGPYNPSVGLWGAAIPFDDREIPNDLRLLLESRPDPTAPWQLNRVLDFLGESWAKNHSDVYQVLGGIEGSLPNRDLTYDVHVSTGRTMNLFLSQGHASAQRYWSLVSAGDWGREGFVFNNNYYQTCETGLPIFESFTPSADCFRSMLARLKVLTKTEQTIVEANVQGRIMDIPGGELRFAAGVARRSNYFLFEPSETNDVTSVIEQTQSIFANARSEGSTKVQEIYGELLVPLTGRLELELGYRYSDYDQIDSGVKTWKALLSYAPTDSIRFRGGFQLATRPPNIAEMFTSGQAATLSFPGGDPCQANTTHQWGNVPGNPNRQQLQELCRAMIGNDTSDFDTGPGGPDEFVAGDGRPSDAPSGLIVATVEGNRNLQPEEADTWTFGVVFASPGQFENLIASIDVFNISIDDTISPLLPTLAYRQCYNADGRSNPNWQVNDPAGMCQYISRNEETGGTGSTVSPYFNSGVLETRGVDLTINWSTGLGPGRLNINSNASILDHFRYQDNPISEFIDATGTMDQGGLFDYRVTTSFNYTFDRSSLGLQWRYLPSVEHATAAIDPNTTQQGVGPYSVFSLFGRHAVTDRFEVRGGVENLLDKDPPVYGFQPATATTSGNNAKGSTLPGGFHDLLGRRYYVGMKYNF